MRVAILLLNYNGMDSNFDGKPILRECVRLLVKNTDPGIGRIIAMDNGSTDGSPEFLRKSGLEVLRREKNLYNFSAVNNQGILYAAEKYDPEYFITISNDIFVKDRRWLEKMLEVADADPRLGIETCKLVYPSGKIQQAGGIAGVSPRSRGRGEPDRGQYDRAEKVGATCFSFCMIKKSTLEKVGMFDEGFRFGFEDTDFSLRTRKAGLDIVYNGLVSHIHLEGFTHSNSPKESVRDMFFYNQQRNYMYFAFKNLGILDRSAAILLELGAAVFSIESKDRSRGLASLRRRTSPSGGCTSR